jgi:hypothetical protein
MELVDSFIAEDDAAAPEAADAIRVVVPGGAAETIDAISIGL